MERLIPKLSLVALLSTGSILAQTADPQNQYPVQPPPAQADGNWHRFSDAGRPSPTQGTYSSSNPSPVPTQNPNQTAPAYDPAPPAYNQAQSFSQPQPFPPAFNVQPSLTIPAGTWLTVRTTNPISSDRNQAGDAFGAILTQPVVVNGIVIARRGQSIEGRVTSAEKAGHVKGVSKLGLELIQMALVDGQQVNLHTQLAQRNGNTSFGRDAAAIGVTTGTGAAIGAAVNGGVGAGVGAGIGLVASVIGVMATRGEPSVIYPETVLTFKTLEPITISTSRSPQAFQQVNQQDYEGNTGRLVSSTPPSQRGGYGSGYGYATPYPYAAPYYSPYYSFGYGYGRGYGYGYGFGPGFYYYGGGRYRR